MIRSRRCARVVIGFLATSGLFFLPSSSLGQGTGLNLTGSSNCTMADFDTDLQFVNGPADYYTIVVNKRNISHHPCVFDGLVYGPSFAPDRVPGSPPFTRCYVCENRQPNAQSTDVAPLTLSPGQVAQQTFRWKTVPPAEAGPCLQPQWMSGPVLLVAPSLLKQICSDYEVSRFSLATSSDSKSQAVDGAQAPGFALTSDKSMYYQGEPFSLHLTLAQPGPWAPSKEESCPTLYLRQRSPDGTTRIDEVEPLAFKGCLRIILGHEPGDWRSGFDLDSGANTKWEGLGEHTMEVFQLKGSRDDPQLHFVSSNVLRIQLADPSSIPRRWGTRVKGIAADITLDKDTYRVGEDIPLHLAVENFDAEVPIYGWDRVWDPDMAVGIEVQGAGGRRLAANDRFPNRSFHMDHGFGPTKLYAKGMVVPLERTLGEDGWLPNHPGAYTVVVTWAPCTGSINDAPIGHFSWAMKPYAVVHATANIRIVSSDSSNSDWVHRRGN